MKKGIVTLIGVVGLASVASAQSGATFLMTSTNANGGVVNQANPSTTIEVWASWTGAEHLMGGSNFDLTAGDGTFSGETLVLGTVALGSNPGVAAGSVVTGAVIGQLHIPGIVPGLEDNPILLSSYTWTTADFTGRVVGLDTSGTVNFLVAAIATGATTNLFPAEFRDGSGSIKVTPAPSALALLGLGGLVAVRRRRSSTQRQLSENSSTPARMGGGWSV